MQEVIEDGRNGWLVDFFDVEAIADRVSNGLSESERMDDLREAARRTVLDRYALKDCLATQKSMITEAVTGF